MSFVIASPEYVAAAASDLANIAHTISSANVLAMFPTSSVVAAGADEVSAGIAALFTAHAQAYQALSAQASLFHQQFVQLMAAGAGLYASAEASNKSLADISPAASAAATGSPFSTVEQTVVGAISSAMPAILNAPVTGSGSGAPAAAAMPAGATGLADAGGVVGGSGQIGGGGAVLAGAGAPTGSGAMPFGGAGALGGLNGFGAGGSHQSHDNQGGLFGSFGAGGAGEKEGDGEAAPADGAGAHAESWDHEAVPMNGAGEGAHASGGVEAGGHQGGVESAEAAENAPLSATISATPLNGFAGHGVETGFFGGAPIAAPGVAAQPTVAEAQGYGRHAAR